MPTRTPVLSLGEPTVVSRGPVGLTHWGPWQFPNIERLSDGRLHVMFHVEADSAKAYGLPRQHAVSSDGGKTWQPVSAAPADSGLLLPNGDRLRSLSDRSRPVAGLSLPAPLVTRKGTYGSTYHIFAKEDLPADLQGGWRFARRRAGEEEWIEETASVDLPGEIQYVAEDVLTYPRVWRMRVAPDGSLWLINYGWRAPDRRLRELWAPMFLRSTDNGHSFRFLSEIPYHGDASKDPSAGRRDGFTEPIVAFLSDGSIFCLLRTTDGNGPGPLYASYSHDDGHTWSTPVWFDDLGVCPALLMLDNGVILASYGRPGLYLRASADPAAIVWADRVPVIEPRAIQRETCSYSDLLAVDDHSALLAYSDFNYPDEEGRPRKTILVRSVTLT